MSTHSVTPAHEIPTASASSAKHTVLVVEDDPYVAAVLWTLLNQFDFNVVSETSGPQGLERARRLAPDAVILDVGLPEMNGLEICRQLKSNPETSALPVIFFSGQGQLAEEALKLGADAFLVKPNDVMKLPECLRRAISQTNSAAPASASPD